MHKSFILPILASLYIVSILLPSQSSHAVNLIKPIGKDCGYEEYSFSVLEDYKLNGELYGISQLNGAAIQTNEMHTILRSQFVYGLRDSTNLFIEVSYDNAEIESLQEVDYIRSNFEKSVNENYHNLSVKLQVFELLNKKDANIGYSYGAIFPKLNENDMHTKAYSLLLGLGYNKDILNVVEFEIRPTFGYYPKLKKVYFENKISFIKRMRNFNAELNFDSFVNEAKIRDLSYLSDLDDYLTFGPINRIIGGMVREELFPKHSELSLVDYNIVSFKLSKKVFRKSSVFLKFSHVLKNRYDFAKSSFTIGFFNKF